MKKHNEGYALPFVLVVLVVMSLIAVGIMDFSLRNLESQQKTIQRIEAKYEAAGKIEKIVAAMQTNLDDSAPEFVFPGSNDLSDGFSFRIENGVLRIAVSHVQEEQEQNLWIIAALKPAEFKGMKTGTEDDDGNKPLTIKNCGTVQYLWYEIVDEEMASRFISGQYIPFSMDGGNAP